MMTSEGAVDGSWELTVTVTDLMKEKTLRVKGDLHIGGLMLRLVDALDITHNWSDHGLWWPDKNLWLSRTRSTLDQYGVQADAKLCFTPMHKNLRVLLPDLQVLDMPVNFSKNVFTVVIKLCKELGIRHPEELSLSRKMDREELKKNKGVSATRRTQVPGLANANGNSYDSGTLGSPYRTPGGTLNTPQGTLMRSSTPGHSPYVMGHSPNYSFNANGTMTPGSVNSLSFNGALESLSLSSSPSLTAQNAFVFLYRPRNLAEKARINAGWLDSSRSIMEQGIQENDTVLLRYKFFSFYDLSPKYDAVRINQIYEQAKWSLISEEIDCTEEEMMVFAALQLQIQQQSLLPQPDHDSSNQAEDEIDSALTDLQVSLEGSSVSHSGDITRTPELHDSLRYFKPKKFGFKSYKRGYFLFKDTHLHMYNTVADKDGTPALKVNLKGCETNADVNVATQKFNIKLFVPSHDGMTELWLRADSEEQYAKWMAAFRLASKGRTMADSSYDQEVKSIISLLGMQHPAPASPAPSPGDVNFQPENYVAPRFVRKMKSGRQISQRILEAHANVRDMRLVEAKLNYIKAWQTLPEYGLTYFIVKLKGSKKEDLMAVAFNRLIRMDLNSGDSLKTWRYQNMKTWSVNWEIKQVQVAFEEEDLAFQCLTADCKVVHEYIGGYIFLSMRSGDKNQSLNEEMFHKLTGGWHEHTDK